MGVVGQEPFLKVLQKELGMYGGGWRILELRTVNLFYIVGLNVNVLFLLRLLFQLLQVSRRNLLVLEYKGRLHLITMS